MTADELFEAFERADRAGERPSPHAYLQRAAEADREVLADRIDAYLDHAEATPSAPSFASFRANSLAQRAMTAAEPALTGETWVTLLPAARHEAQVTRLTLVDRLANALGVGDRTEVVGDYYHRMEIGTLPPEGVSDRVLETLSAIVSIPVQRLRDAGARLGPPPPSSGAVFARRAAAEGAAPSAPASSAEVPDDDEVAKLFTGR